MKSFSDIVKFYNQRFAFHKEALLTDPVRAGLKVIVVIPAFNEDLTPTLESLEKCDLNLNHELEVLLVINHSENSDITIKEQHHNQWHQLKDYSFDNKLNCHIIRAFDLPKKHAGVGLARKIGMDEALKRFERLGYDGMIVCLDADCRVSKNYLESILSAEREGINGMSLYYEHAYAEIEDKDHKKAIVDYEIFLRYYSLGLKKAGYPFPFQTVGSSMAARASIYAKIGGMNRRKAGEDFYFLHKVFPQGDFHEWTDCTVYPSARKSDRVPFGTGKAMLAAEAGEKDYAKVYHPHLFTKLGNWLNHLHKEPPSLILEFLESEGWRNEMQELHKRSRTKQQFQKNFFHWFDGFKVLKYLHFAQSGNLEDLSNVKACSAMLKQNFTDQEELLLHLRKLEKERPFPTFEGNEV